MSSSSSLIESLSSGGRSRSRRSVSFGGDIEERVYDKRSKQPIASNELSGSIIRSSVASYVHSPSSLKQTSYLKTPPSTSSSSAVLDHDVSYSSSSVDSDIEYPYRPSHYYRRDNGDKERLDNSDEQDDGDAYSDNGDWNGRDNDEDDTEEREEEEEASQSPPDCEDGPMYKQPHRPQHQHHHHNRERRHERNNHGRDMEASEVTASYRDLYAPLDKSELRRKSGKMKRDVYRMDEAVNNMISDYSPRKLATTPKGVSLLVDVTKLQLHERVNAVLAEQIVAMRESRMAATSSSSRNKRRGDEPLAYDERSHSKAGGKARHSTLAMTGTSGAKYSIRASGEKQYYH